MSIEYTIHPEHTPEGLFFRFLAQEDDGNLEERAKLSVQEMGIFGELIPEALEEAYLPLGLRESSNIDRVLYCAARASLRVYFKRGAAYEYFGVPQDLVEAWCAAESTGSFFAKVLKGKDAEFPCRKLETV